MPYNRDKQGATPAGDELAVIVTRGKEVGREFSGWESISVVRNLNAAAGSWTLTVSDRLPWPLLPSDRIQIRMAGKLVLTGSVDAIEASSGSGEHRVRVSGRDLTAILIDSSALNDPGEWFDIGLVDLATELCDPFGIRLSTDLGAIGLGELANFDHFKLQPGESAWNAIERACRLRAVLAHATEKGELKLVQGGLSGAADESLIEGPYEGYDPRDARPGNLLRTQIRYSHADRYNLYVVRGQRSGDDSGWGEDIALSEGRAFDPEISEERMLLVLAEGQVTFSSAADRAQWEATQRAAKSSTVTCQLAGWRQNAHPFAALWSVNLRVSVQVPSLQLDAGMLIEQVQFTRSLREGTRTSLRLVRSDAFEAKPVVDQSAQPFSDLLGGEEVGFWDEDAR